MGKNPCFGCHKWLPIGNIRCQSTCGFWKICINGAAAHLVHPGDLVILITYEGIPSDSVSEHLPTIVHVNTQNEVIDISQEIDAVEYVEFRP